MHKTLPLSLFVLLLSFHFCQSQLIANGDFESWTGSCPSNTAPDGWTNYSTQLAPDEAGACMGNVTAHGGSSFMNLVWINQAVLEGAMQNLNGLNMGSVYRVSFWGINSQGIYADPGDCVLQVHRNSTPIYSTPNLVSGGAWTYYSVDFTVTSPLEPIGIRVVGGASGTSGSAGVDDFAVTELVDVRDGMMHPLAVYPSPASEALYISPGDYITAQFDQAPFSITNVLGQEVQHAVCQFADGKGMVDVRTLEAGVYYIRLRVDGEEYVRKFVVR